MLLVAKTRMDAGCIMVVERVTGPASKRKHIQPGETLLLVGADMAGSDSLGPHQREVEHEMQLITAIAHVVNVVIFADEHAIPVVFVEDGAQLFHQIM